MKRRVPSLLPLISFALCGAACVPLVEPTSEASPPKPRPVTPPAPMAVERAVGRGVDFLLGRQNKDGSWGSARRTKGLNIYAPVPGAHHAFRSAVTSMCVSALIGSGDERPAVREAVRRGEEWIVADLPKLRRANPTAIYNVWGHAYGMQALARMAARRSPDDPYRDRLLALIDQQIELLGRYESVDGGWGYYDFRAHTKKPSSRPNSFTTATVLVAFHDARELGRPPPPKLLERAIATVLRQRKPDSTYLYSGGMRWYPMVPINRPGGSLGRSQACNVALRLWGSSEITDAVLETWLDRLFARSGWLDIGRKRPVPHESWFAVAGYFFYYGHYYAALCIEQLPAERRRRFQDHMAHVLLRLQEKDGSWWDYPFYDYHQPYGTAFALMTLERCRGR
ncbi:MAG: prenyltransferase/squalene oxidase repeat-containing protein [Planctomycetota bacterium]